MSEQRSTSTLHPGGESSDVPRILVVDDDPEIRQALETFFHLEGCSVTSASNGEDALQYLRDENGFDLVLLDVMLPKINGFEVLRQSQEMGTSSPVLMMSGRGDQEDILKGFGLGAQDYIIKPFDAEDLVSRTKHILGHRHDADRPLGKCQIGLVEVNFKSNVATKGDKPIELTEMELDLLRCLVRNRGYVVTKKRLLKEAWRIDEDLIAYTIDPDIAIDKVDQTIEAIRKKVESEPSKPQYIETVYGLGYRFTG